MPEITYRDALKQSIIELMEKDADIILIGEDIGIGYDGIFGVTSGLYDIFGPERVVNTPICEASIIGCAIGASLLGLKTIAEIMFEDFIFTCMDHVANQAAKIKLLSANQFRLNMVIRTPCGSSGYGATHSQCLESIFMHIPGILIAMPSNAYDAKGLLKTAIYAGDPVLFIEHQKLYKEKCEVPEGNYKIPFGQGNIVKEGNDFTVVAFSNMVNIAKSAAIELKKSYGIDIEIIDPRTLVPLDIEMIINSVKKTSRLAIIEEGVLRGGIGAEIASQIYENIIDYLDSPIKRIASKNTIIPLSKSLEKEVVPNKEKIIQEIISSL